MSFLPLDAPRAQLVATLGPASVGAVGALAAAGATSFRINASHVTPAETRAMIERVRAELPTAPVVVDLQGGKMRVGELGAPRAIAAGEGVRFALVARDPGEVPLPHPELYAAVRAGDTIGADDDRLRFRVTAASPAALEAVALVAGTLRARKGVNVLEHPVRLAALTARDLTFLEALAAFDGLAFAFSFMRDGSEAAWLRARTPAAVVGKIEQAAAIEHLGAIDAAVDATWICRGDLGAQLGVVELARTVAALDPRAHRRPMIIAGQVLEHLTHHAEPTRSEVCHLHDLLARGYAGLVLSDETAIGHDPVNAVRHAAALLGAFARA